MIQLIIAAFSMFGSSAKGRFRQDSTQDDVEEWLSK